jgi:hypothetical protein
MSMSPSHVATALAVLALCRTCTAAGDTVSARQRLRGNDTLVSAQGKFELGFFSPDGSGRFYLGIWYKNIPAQTVIWIGNRVSPLSSVASAELRVSSDTGDLQLLGSSPSDPSASSPRVLWSSNLSSSSAGSSSNVAVMRDDGNLVLLDGGSSSKVLWQSFDYPTDTLIPEAWLGEEKQTGVYQRLTSWRNAEDPAPGMFTDTIDPNNVSSSEFFYLWNGTRAYWRSGAWTGRVFANVPDAVNNVLFNQTYLDTPAYRRVTWRLYDNATLTRLVLDFTGQTKQYIWVPDSRSWSFFWAAPTVQCDVYALCGAFGVCNQRTQPPCQCPPGFAPAADREWRLSNWSAGCRRNTPLRCSSSAANGSTTATTDDGFLELQDMKLPVLDGDDYALNVTSARSREECESVCLNTCSCQAYVFSGSGSGACTVWHGGFRNLQHLFADGSPSLYLRLSRSELQNLRGGGGGAKKKHGTTVWLVVLACVALAASALVASVVILWTKRRRRLEAEQANQQTKLQFFSHSELRAATNNFSERLGGGGFGSVYRGVVNNNGQTTLQVAVKKLEGLRQGEKQFRAEVNTLGLIQHVNLVRLVGFCASGNDTKLLVYEYMPNSSLDAYLFRPSSSAGAERSCLPWSDRYGVMLGIARGLAYLHEGCRECIIHCDVKPENVLLDTDLTPKIADFGMAKLVGRDFSRVLTTMRGTIGYLAPEWISGLPIGPKADVYSFGMLLFELISGQRNADAGNHNTEEEEDAGRRRPSTFFPVWAASRVAEGNTAAVADARLRGEVSDVELRRACRVACWCIQDQEAHRPTMAQVVQALEGVVDVHLPPVPRALQHLATLA